MILRSGYFYYRNRCFYSITNLKTAYPIGCLVGGVDTGFKFHHSQHACAQIKFQTIDLTHAPSLIRSEITLLYNVYRLISRRII